MQDSGCDLKHCRLVVMEKPSEGNQSRDDEIIDSYVKTQLTLTDDYENQTPITSSSRGTHSKSGKQRRSKVWQHFTKIMKEDGKCQCNHCQKLLTCSSRNGTTHLLRHITICPVLNKDNYENQTPPITSGKLPKHSRRSQTKGKAPCEVKLRSKVWQHFTKIIKEDGMCQCNHCEKLFTCSPRSGTSHLLRHITDGICPVKKDKSAITISSYSPRRNNGLLESQPLEDYENTTPSTPSSRNNEFRKCVGKLVELLNGKIPVGVFGAGPDYSVSAALKCLNEMDDIPQTSEMYLDVFEILQDAGERECFICLPPEPRRRWMQRVLHRRHPLRYGSNLM